MEPVHDIWHDFTDTHEELNRRESVASPNPQTSHTELLFPDDSSKGWEFIHRFFNRSLFEEVKKGKAMQALEDVVEAYLGDLFRRKDIIYPSDVAAGLDLDYDQVEKIFVKFVRQGKLKD